VIRPFTADDIEFAVAQTTREGWDPTPAFFGLCLACDPDGCFIAEADGQRVGLITTTCYVRTGWIGNLIVAPERRRRGIGERLMRHALGYLARRAVGTVRLDADPAGVPLYLRLGFVDEYESPRLRLAAAAAGREREARRVTPADLPALAAFDWQHFGDQRAKLLEHLCRQACSAFWLGDAHHVQGYALAVPSRLGVRIGPWIATERAVAEQLLGALMYDLRGTPLVVAVPGPNRDALELLASLGFARTSSCRRMVLGPPIAGGHPEHVYALANGAMG
jgi:ribosomal protein S18 acetylase RimI-like enzyme